MLRRLLLHPVVVNLLICSLFFTCTATHYSHLPDPFYYKYHPTDTEIKWHSGNKYVTRSDENFDVSSAFVESTKDYLVFDIEIKNRSNKSILVAPDSIYAVNMAEESDSMQSKIYAVNPEIKIEELNRELNPEQNEQEKGSDVGKVILGILLIISIVGIIYLLRNNEDHDSSSDYDDFAQESRIDDLEAENSSLKNQQLRQTLLEEKNRFESDAFRKTTLSKNQSIKGKIYFLNGQYSEIIHLCIPVATNTFVFEYGVLENVNEEQQE